MCVYAPSDDGMLVKGGERREGSKASAVTTHALVAQYDIPRLSWFDVTKERHGYFFKTWQ